MSTAKREFHCPRGVLVKEMQYFSEYLSSDTQLLDEVDISVHCDIPVFEWLMRYAKRGLFEGPQGEILESPLKPPKLEPETVVSILISSNFLKMNSLVRLCSLMNYSLSLYGGYRLKSVLISATITARQFWPLPLT